VEWVLVVGFPAGALQANCYLLARGAGHECVVIDPGEGAAERVERSLSEHCLTPAGVLVTHGHTDHVAGAASVAGTHQVPVWIRQEDRERLSDTGAGPRAEPAEVAMLEAGELDVAGLRLSVDHTPGHTPGSAVFRVDSDEGGMLAFTGDTLLPGSIGRVDLPGGDAEGLARSLRTALLPLPDATVVLPGHGGATTIGRERVMSEKPPAERTPAAEPERIPLYGDDPGLRRRRALSGLAGVVLFAAAFGGIAGLIGGQLTGLVVAAVVALPLLYLVSYSARRRVWLEKNQVAVRTWRVRRIDLVAASRLDLLVTDVRGTRTVGLLVNAGQRGKAVKIDLAVYAGTGGRELPILALRRLADAVLNNIEANGMVFSELLVAQLRAEARGDPAADRPLYRLASVAPTGKFAQRFSMEAVSRFVATLE
jgi:glyoxylase-like metal-dependent hydrolase (beta-lactamase superfamily II)